jgi:hypothetical protein
VNDEAKLRSWNISAFKKRIVGTMAFGIPIRSSDVVHVLKKANSNDDVWFVLACWLREEAIREPEDFLPESIYSRLTQSIRQRLKGISFNDMRLFELVRCWERYFTRLLADKRRRSDSTDLRKELCAAGYVPEAVDLVMRKKWRSTVELTCEWLAARDVIPAKTKDPDPVSTLRNAYSRIKAESQPKRPRLDSSRSAKKAK